MKWHGFLVAVVVIMANLSMLNKDITWYQFASLMMLFAIYQVVNDIRSGIKK